MKKFIINRAIDSMTEKTLSDEGNYWTDNFISDSKIFESEEEAKKYIASNFEENEYNLSVGFFDEDELL